MGKYDVFSEEELRVLFFKGELSAESMTEEDYTALYQQELDFDDPDDGIIDFCFNGLSKFPKYRDISAYDFDIDDLLNKVYGRKTVLKRLVRVLAGFSAAVLVIISAQAVCLAFGFDLFGYIVNRNKEDVVSVMNTNLTETDSGNEDFLTVFEYFEVADIPDEVIKLMPGYMFEKYAFYYANCGLFDGTISIYSMFFANNDAVLTLTITQLPERQLEKDDEGYAETYTVKELSFEIHTNMGDYQAFWIKDGYVYSLHTPYRQSEELKSLLDNLY
jgi:hypothetical protein